MYLCAPHICLIYTEVRVPETRVTRDCEMQCGSRELNPVSLREQHVLLTAEPSFKPLNADHGSLGFPAAQHSYEGFQLCFSLLFSLFLLDKEAETPISPENKVKENRNRKTVFLLLLN